jgi:hypothetical protein
MLPTQMVVFEIAWCVAPIWRARRTKKMREIEVLFICTRINGEH